MNRRRFFRSFAGVAALPLLAVVPSETTASDDSLERHLRNLRRFARSTGKQVWRINQDLEPRLSNLRFPPSNHAAEDRDRRRD